MTAPRFRITATASDYADGERMECFIWTRDAASGIERAKRDAQRFNMPHLRDFRAEPIA